MVDNDTLELSFGFLLEKLYVGAGNRAWKNKGVQVLVGICVFP